MSMNVKSRRPPFIFFVKKGDPPPGSSKIQSDLPLCCVKFMLTLPFRAGKKVNDHPLNFSGPPPLLKNECSLTSSVSRFFIETIPKKINTNYCLPKSIFLLCEFTSIKILRKSVTEIALHHFEHFHTQALFMHIRYIAPF